MKIFASLFALFAMVMGLSVQAEEMHPCKDFFGACGKPGDGKFLACVKAKADTGDAKAKECMDKMKTMMEEKHKEMGHKMPPAPAVPPTPPVKIPGK